jgi:hypothetical protein
MDWKAKAARLASAAKLTLMLFIALLAIAPVSAQQVTGELGSPSATTTIDGKQLPPPAPPFGGVIKQSALDSTPWWAPTVAPPKGAPREPGISHVDMSLRSLTLPHIPPKFTR